MTSRKQSSENVKGIPLKTAEEKKKAVEEFYRAYSLSAAPLSSSGTRVESYWNKTYFAVQLSNKTEASLNK